MTAPFDFGIHLDLFSGANTPFGIAEGRNPYKRGQAAQDAAFVLRIVEAMRAPFLYLDVSKAYVPPMPPRQMHGDGLL